MSFESTLTVRVRRWRDRAFLALSLLCLALSLVALAALVGDLASNGLPRIDRAFLTSFPSRFASEAGLLAAWVGSLFVILVTAALAIPIGIAAGVYLEEYAPKNLWTNCLEVAMANLAGVPSIVFGLMALGLFVYRFGLGQSVLTAGLTLGLLVLPIVVVATRESLRAIPGYIREASFAVGGSKWQTIRHHVLPYSTGGILTGVIVAVSRALGETAPLVTVGALTFITFLPTSVMDPFTVLPIQMFNWVSRPQEDFHANAAAAGVLLLLLTLSLNGVALCLRYRSRKRVHW